MEKFVSDLDWLRGILVAAITGGGGFGVFRLWKLFSSDFLTPYRDDLGELRERIEGAEAKAEQARLETIAARERTQACEEREARLRVELIRAGVPLPPQEPHP